MRSWRFHAVVWAVAGLLTACTAGADDALPAPVQPLASPAPATSATPTRSTEPSTIAYTRAEASGLAPRRPDPNGCPVRHGWAPEHRSPAGTVSVCGYRHGLIVSSERLTGVDATAAVSAIRRAPTKAARLCPWEKVRSPAIDLITPRGTATLLWRRCTGLNWRTARREITAEVLYWALSPGTRMHLPGRVAVPADLLGFRRG